MQILILDNYDSFTYNLVHLLEQFPGNYLDIIRNDKITVEEVNKYDKILLSPGPGIPSEAGILLPLIKKYASSKSILGVCLGHQAIAEVFNGNLFNMDKVMHGVATETTVIDEDENLFKGIPRKFMTGRYHSWAVDKASLPDCFKITAVDGNQDIMAISHKQFDVKGVQFHPESILTENGKKIIENWLNT
jgi:anthranilate synthase component II